MDERREALQKEYSEVCQNFRLLTDIRFRLLAFLPIATAVAVALKNGSAAAPTLGLSLFGLVVTLGLVTYNMRNDQLYNELVGRAAAIERNLGLPDGGFAHRPRAWLVVDLPKAKCIPWRTWTIDHGTGVGTIYVASVALWLFGVIASVLGYARQAFVGLFPSHSDTGGPAHPSIWVVDLAAFALTILITHRAVKAINRQSKDKSSDMRNSARLAVKRAMELKPSELQTDPIFLQECEKLSGKKGEVILNRLEFYSQLSPERLNHYMLQGPDSKVTASHLVALLTDLPGGWIYDSATNRKGLVTRDT